MNPQRNRAEILLKKQRNGPTGEIFLTYLNAYTRFENFIEDPFSNQSS
jgi:replicative DNA helicase